MLNLTKEEAAAVTCKLNNRNMNCDNCIILKNNNPWDFQKCVDITKIAIAKLKAYIEDGEAEKIERKFNIDLDYEKYGENP